MRLVVFLAALLFSTAAQAQQAVNTWAEVPNSALGPLLPTVAEFGSADCTEQKHCTGKLLGIWVGMDYDRSTGDWCLPKGGGHGDRGGNESYCYNFRTKTWRRADPVKQLTGPVIGDCETVPYGPNASHTYDGVLSLRNGKLIVFARMEFCRGSNLYRGPWIADTTQSAPGQPAGSWTWTEWPEMAERSAHAASVLYGGFIWIYNASNGRATIINADTLEIVSTAGAQVGSPLSAASMGAMGVTENGDACVADASRHVCWHLTVTNGVPSWGTPTIKSIANAPVGSILKDWPRRASMAALPDGRLVGFNGGDIFTYNPMTDAFARYARPAVYPLNTAAVGGDADSNGGKTYSRLEYIPDIDCLAALINTQAIWTFRLDGLTCEPPPPPEPEQQGSNFEQRRHAPGVIFSQGFDVPIAKSSTAPEGVFLNASVQKLATSVLPRVENGAMRFEVKSNSAPAGAGQYYAAFPTVTGKISIFVQWRQFISPELLLTPFDHTNGTSYTSPKLAIISAPGNDSCTANHVVVVKDNWNGKKDAPRTDGKMPGSIALYHGCGHYENIRRAGPVVKGSTLRDTQPIIGDAERGALVAEMRATGALAPGGLSTGRKCWSDGSDRSGCVGMRDGVWVTYQLGVEHVGEPYAFKNNGEIVVPARVTFTQKVDGEPSVLVIDAVRGLRAQQKGYGKVWFLPYMTAKDPTQSHPDAITLVDEVIVATKRIPDPA